MDFRPVEEGEDRSDSEGSHNEEAKEVDKTHGRESVKTEHTAAAGKKDFSSLSFKFCFHLPAQLNKVTNHFRSNRRNSQRIFTIHQVRYSTKIPVTRAITYKPA